MSKMKNFRLSDEDQVILDALASDWRMSERAVVSELLHRHDPRGGVHVEPDPELGRPKLEGGATKNAPHRKFEPIERVVEAPVDLDGAASRVIGEMTRGSIKRAVKVPVPDWKKDGSVARGETRTLTGRAHGSVPKGGKK